MKKERQMSRKSKVRLERVRHEMTWRRKDGKKPPKKRLHYE